MLINKVAIVTGSSRGIGAEIARYLANEGVKVVINYSSSEEKANLVVNEIKNNGGEAFAVRANIASVNEINKLFESTIKKYGKVDIVVNNAGTADFTSIKDVTEERFDNLFNLNVKGTYFMCKKALELMEQGGSIINFSSSSLNITFTSINYSLYAGTRGAVEQMTKHLAKEFREKNIKINAIAPGGINTESFRNSKSPEEIEQIEKLIGIGDPSDIASAVSFLASEKSKWISGQTIYINGGFI